MKKYIYVFLFILTFSLYFYHLQAMEQQENQIQKAQTLMASYKHDDKISALKIFINLVKNKNECKEAISSAQNGLVRGILEQNNKLTKLALTLFQLLIENTDTREKRVKLKYIKKLLIEQQSRNLDTLCIDWIRVKIINDWDKNI